MTREDWIRRVRQAAGALDGFADRAANRTAIEPLRELAEACHWAASRLTVENPAALPSASAPAVTPALLDDVLAHLATAKKLAPGSALSHIEAAESVLTAALGGPNG